MWAIATGKAEQALLELEQEFYGSVPRTVEQLPGSWDELVNETAHRAIDFKVQVFDIWAERGLSGIVGGTAGLDYSAWLWRYSRECVNDLKQLGTSGPEY